MPRRQWVPGVLPRTVLRCMLASTRLVTFGEGVDAEGAHRHLVTRAQIDSPSEGSSMPPAAPHSRGEPPHRLQVSGSQGVLVRNVQLGQR